VSAIEEGAKECKIPSHQTGYSDMQNAALQLAVCYEIGFGVVMDKTNARNWLEKSGNTEEKLQELYTRFARTHN